MRAPLFALAVVLIPVAVETAAAASLIANGMTRLETQDMGNSLRLRNLLTPSNGFKTGEFAWNAAKNAWVRQGPLKAEDSYYAQVQLWKHYDDKAKPQSESLSLWAGGKDVSGVSFRSPDGVDHDSICQPDGSNWGLNMFDCSDQNLAVGQKAYAAGKYVVTYTLASGGTVKRTFYVSGGYPAKLTISYPAKGAVGVSTTPTVKWTAIGAEGYDLLIRDADQNEIYDMSLRNSVDTNLSFALPAGVLQPGTHYYLTIEANAPIANGGTKGIKKRIDFWTAQ